ncbi:hypothetical protein ACFLUU_09875 [Chloroflexota bacterium]
MSKKREVNQDIDRLAEKLYELAQIFRQGGKANDFEWWNSNSPRSIFYPLYGYQDGQPLFEAVVQGVLNLNPEMLSEHEVQIRLMYDFLQVQTISVIKPDHLNNQSLVEEAKNHLNKLIIFKAWQDVDIPITNLWLEGEPVELGYVTFTAATEQDLEKWKSNLVVWSQKAPDVHVLARIRSPGDRQRALSYARSQVDLTLDVLRAFCFPVGRHSDTWQIGVVGDVISYASTPMRINEKDLVTQLGPGIAQNELRKHILPKLKQLQWELVNKLILKAYHTNMERKLLDGIHWLAESTKPDTNNSKFAKIGFALETLIGGEPKDEDLRVRGITAMLAERAAFITGEDLDDRLAIDKGIRKYYGMRSTIVHGGEGDVSLDDIDEFGQLVRHLALALLEKLDELGNTIGDVEELERWVKVQRYTLPEHNGKKEVA